MVLKICPSYKKIIQRGKSSVKHMRKRNGNRQGDDVISKDRTTTSVTTKKMERGSHVQSLLDFK